MFYSYKNANILINGQDIAANNIDINLQSNIAPQYLSEDRHSSTYIPVDGLGGNLKLNYYLTGADYIKTFTVDETNRITGKFGGLTINSGYLKSYNFNFTPNQIAEVNADIVFFDQLTGVFTPTYNNASNTSILCLADATISDPTNGSIGNLSNITNFNYSFNADIQPIYHVEEKSPNKVFFGIKEITVQIETDNLSGDLPISGRDAVIVLNFAHPNINGLVESYSCSGTLFQRNIRSSIGDTIKSNLFLKQNFIDDPATVTSFSPNNGNPGSTVAVVGQNFTNAYNFFFNDVEDTSFVINSDTSITATVPANGITGPLKVRSTKGIGQASSSNFTINYPPILISGIIPLTGNINDNIKISGDNFYRINNVIFNTGVTGIFRVVNSNIIEATVNEFTAWGPITVTSTERDLTGVSSQFFVPVPRIDKFTPGTGITGDLITIEGRGFSGITGVKFNNLPSLTPFTATFTVLSNTGIQVNVPSGNTKGFIRISGQSGVTVLSTTEFSPTVSITGTVPLSGFTGIAVDVLGNNFIPSLMYETIANNYLISFNGATGSFVRINQGRLTGIVPSSATSGIIKIFASDFSTYSSNVSFSIRHNTPTITSISPSSGKHLDYFTVYGGQFYDITSLQISGNSGIQTLSNPSVGVLGDKITFQLPNATGGKHNVTINTIEGSATGINILTVLQQAYISGYNPLSGAIGNLITLTGNNIYPNSKIYFTITGTEAVVDTGSFVNLEYQLKFYVPTNATGNSKIVIYNTVDYTTGTTLFTLINKPFISGFIPSSGEIGSGINISGSYLSNSSGIKIGSLSVNSYSFIGSTGLNITIPENSVTDYINLYSAAGTITSSGQLAVLTPFIQISGFIPTRARYGDEIILTGSRMNTAITIKFSGNNTELSFDDTNFTKLGSTGISVFLPSAVISGKIKLINVRGESVSPYNLEIINVPIVNFFEPSQGIFKDSINVSGNYLNGMAFGFQGLTGLITGLETQVINDTGAYFKIPREIISGPITVSGSGSLWSTSSGIFTVLPTITGFNPRTLTTGQTLTITGINAYEANISILGLSGNNTVYNIVNGNLSGNFYDLTGAGIINYTTGFSIFNCTVNPDFGGTGRLFFVSNEQTTGNNINNFISTSSYSITKNIINSGIITINQSAPVISSFTPISGNNNTIVTITGSSLGGVTGIYILTGNTVISTGSIISANSSNVTVYPANVFSQIGTGLSFKIYNDFGNVSSSATWRFINSPDISGFTPLQGTIGSKITISGSGLNDVTGLYFGTYSGTFSIWSQNNSYVITGTVPNVEETLPRQYSISIVNNARTSVANSLFTVLAGDTNISGSVNVQYDIRAGGGFFGTGYHIETTGNTTGTVVLNTNIEGDNNYYIDNNDVYFTDNSSSLIISDNAQNFIVFNARISGRTWRMLSSPL